MSYMFRTIEPFVTLPTVQSGTSMAGGGLRNPGDLTAPDGQKPEPAAMALVVEAPAIVRAVQFLRPVWPYLERALVSGGRIVLNQATDVLQATKEALGLSPEQLGNIVTEAPDGGTYEDYLARPVTAKAEELSKIEREIDGYKRNPGSCNDDEFRELDKRKNEACSKPMSCADLRKPPDTTEVLNRIANAKTCIDARINIMDMCFDGGDKGHHNQAEQRLVPLRECQKLLLAPGGG